ncbi:MAG: PEP-CTERM sorting domain-containing protein [Candidatus Hydrogenedentes bacterium]|nr:PEP-CTERM sorting domain-containing protein [Candidatus Hydrogenedentota bacterium]
MKRTIVALALGTCMVLVSSMAGATMVTLQFDPNDLLNMAPADATGGKPDQANARRFHQQWATTYYETFTNATNPHAQPADYDAYIAWRDSLNTDGEGIATFNSWFLDNGAARSWGETIVVRPDSVVTATAGDGWSYTIIHDPYGLGGDSVQWYTLDPSQRIRVGSGAADLGPFSITADLYYDSNANGWDATDLGVSLGDAVRFWAGNLNGDDPEFYRSDTAALYFDAWSLGGAANMGSGAGHPGSGFEAALTATAVPEPVTMVMLGCLGAGMAAARKFRRKNKA